MKQKRYQFLWPRDGQDPGVSQELLVVRPSLLQGQTSSGLIPVPRAPIRRRPHLEAQAGRSTLPPDFRWSTFRQPRAPHSGPASLQQGGLTAPGQVASCTRDDAQSVYLAVSEGRTGGRGWGTEAIQVENEWINPPVWASGSSEERGASPIQVGATLSNGNTGANFRSWRSGQQEGCTLALAGFSNCDL